MSPLVASPAVRISAKADYAVRALVVLARHAGTDAAPVTVDRIARRHQAARQRAGMGPAEWVL